MNAPCQPSPSFAPTWAVPRVNVQVFNISATYFPSPGLTFVTVECYGGGGGGGTVETSNATDIVAGGGGGSGGYSRSTFPASDVWGGIAVQIGAGGEGANYNNFGNPGGPTIFGTLMQANGGAGGETNDAATVWGGGGAGAVIGIGQVVFPGEAGGPGLIGGAAGFSTASGGAGGSLFGGSTPQAIRGPGQFAGGTPSIPNTGAGGGGAVINQIQGAEGGANGATGVCIVTEYCFGPVSGADDCGPGARVGTFDYAD
jgi:hypothetical protein